LSSLAAKQLFKSSEAAPENVTADLNGPYPTAKGITLLASDTVSNIDGWSGNQSLKAMRCVGIMQISLLD
jgi:hypothetical protein